MLQIVLCMDLPVPLKIVLAGKRLSTLAGVSFRPDVYTCHVQLQFTIICKFHIARVTFVQIGVHFRVIDQIQAIAEFLVARDTFIFSTTLLVSLHLSQLLEVFAAFVARWYQYSLFPFCLHFLKINFTILLFMLIDFSLCIFLYLVSCLDTKP